MLDGAHDISDRIAIVSVIFVHTVCSVCSMRPCHVTQIIPFLWLTPEKKKKVTKKNPKKTSLNCDQFKPSYIEVPLHGHFLNPTRARSDSSQTSAAKKSARTTRTPPPLRVLSRAFGVSGVQDTYPAASGASGA